jgi:Amt family ammonium transporter
MHAYFFWEVQYMGFSTIDTLWVLLATALVFFMQAGFAMVETGFTRAKNAGNIVMKNLMDFSFGSLAFWMIGFGLMYKASGNPFWGGLDFFIFDSSVYDSNIPGYATVMFQTVFCATAATIVSGAMAERTKFNPTLSIPLSSHR